MGCLLTLGFVLTLFAAMAVPVHVAIVRGAGKALSVPASRRYARFDLDRSRAVRFRGEWRRFPAYAGYPYAVLLADESRVVLATRVGRAFANPTVIDRADTLVIRPRRGRVPHRWSPLVPLVFELRDGTVLKPFWGNDTAVLAALRTLGWPATDR
jgi:hypothetical protein